MDSVIQRNIDELLADLKKSGADLNDPVSKLMVTALLYQAQKIKDEIASLPDKVMERLCSCFIPKNKIDAIPSLCMVQLSIKSDKGAEAHSLINGTFFSYKIDNKLSLSFYPLLRNCVLPVSNLHMLATDGKRTSTEPVMAKKGQVWLGIEMPSEIETLENVSFYLKGNKGVLPEKIFVGNDTAELSFVTADNFDALPMMEPFDSQQVSSDSLDVYDEWRRQITETDDGKLIYITDALKDRDVFRCRPYPKSFQQFLEDTDLDKFDKNTLWILFDFGNETDIPSALEIIPNVIPAVNVNMHTVTLTQFSPISRLGKDDGSYFLNIIETPLASQKQGFSTLSEEIVVRDFDADCYNADRLYDDVRKLYNRFIDDYHAFVEYHGLKDGELIRSLRELMNRIGKSVMPEQEMKYRFNEGTYVMRSMGMVNKSVPVKVSYLSTFGRLGNTPKAGGMMENKKDAVLGRDVKVVRSASGGENRASADQRYELLRYYTLTSDRLYTKMDIDAFLRLQLLKEFGKEEIKRITHKISIQGAAGYNKLVRGLYIDIRFKDEKNYRKAVSLALDRKFGLMISDKSCISMPIIIKLIQPEQ